MEIEESTRAFAALSQSSRLKTLESLIKAGPRGIAAGAIADKLETPRPTMSFHLKELERAGLIHARREGRSIVYAADYGGLRDLIDFLLIECCGGDKRVCGPYVIRENS